MASESIKKVQGKLFRGEGALVQPDASIPVVLDGARPANPGLAIHIPKVSTPTPAPPPASRPKLVKQIGPDGSPDKETVDESRPYRDRVFEKLGGQYKGVEKYRLLQDEKKEKHWKRWGPYLSERQWVRLSAIDCWSLLMM